MAARRLLLIRVSALGDVLLTVPLVEALRRQDRERTVELLTDARYVELAESLAVFDRVHGVDLRGEERGALGALRAARRLGGPFDAVVDLQGKLRTRWLALWIPAARRLTLRKRGFARALVSLVGRDPPLARAHATTLYAEVLGLADSPVAALAAGPLADSSDGRSLVAFDPGRPPTGERASAPRRIGLGIGTTHATKRWPAEHFRALAEILWAEDPGLLFVLVGGPSDRSALDAVRALLPPERVAPEDLADASLLELRAALARLALFVTVDSGPAHLAQLLGVPTVVLFGPTSPTRWGPRAGPHRAVALALDCMPCSNTGGPRCPRPDRDHACLRTLDATRVAPTALELLRGGRS